MKKKIVCVLLSFALVLALIPTAFAVADVCTITVTVKDADETETLIAGAEVNLGNFSLPDHARSSSHREQAGT